MLNILKKDSLLIEGSKTLFLFGTKAARLAFFIFKATKFARFHAANHTKHGISHTQLPIRVKRMTLNTEEGMSGFLGVNACEVAAGALRPNVGVANCDQLGLAILMLQLINTVHVIPP